MKYISILLLALLPGLCFGQKVKEDDAVKIALEVFKRNNKGSETELKDIIILGEEGENDTLLYIVPFEGSGYTIISASRAIRPVLGHCSKGDFEPAKIPPGLLYLIDKYKYSISKLKKAKTKPTKKVKNQWDDYLNPDGNQQLKSYTVGSKLINTSWGQQSNYNQFCPTGCPAGCTAVAMAQILRYWECRINPTGTVSYSGFGWQGGSANIGATTYNWLDMNNSSADTNNALLIHHAGISCLTRYNTDGSTSTPGRARDGFVRNWGISSSADVKWRIWHLNTWEDDLKDEIDLERPILYSGGALLGNGHSWVIDGYMSNGNFLCNWGWYGLYDGEYALGDFDPPGDPGPYNQYESAIFNVVPVQSTGVALPQLASQSFTYNSNGYALSIPSAYGATSYQWITDNGTISGSGTSVTLNSESSANVQVRAYNSLCNIYSPYKSAVITINYGSIFAPDVICHSDNTVSIQNVPNTTITWGGTNVSYPNGNTGTSVTVRAASPSTSGNGTVTASFTVNNNPYTIAHPVWVGKPQVYTLGNNLMDINTGMPKTDFCYGEANECEAVNIGGDAHITAWEWRVTGGTVYPYGPQYRYATIYPNSYSNFMVEIRAYNTCGWTDWARMWTEVEDCYGYYMTFSPNPTTGKTTLSIESENKEKTLDETAVWELEIYSPGQVLTQKATNLRGSSTTIQTAGWKEGVYTVRVKLTTKEKPDEILTGKLIVKR